VEADLYSSPIEVQYTVSFYNALLALTGNDIYPTGVFSFVVSSILLVSGALINANILGTIAVIAQTFNRKAQRL